MIEILNICLHQNSIFNMFTINLEHGREAPSTARKKGAKRLEFLVYLNIYFVCLSVCPFVSNKRQTGGTDRAQILCRTSRKPREGLWKIKISKISLQQNSTFFYNVFKEKMFKIEIEDGREAPLKPSIFKNSTHTVYFHSKARGKPKNQIKSNRKKYLRNLR